MLSGGDPKARAWIELDSSALAHNTALLRDRLPPGCALMPAVKADAYGHGAILIAEALQRLGIDAFCVASAAEGAELRQAGIRGTVLVLGYTGPGDCPLLEQYGLTQTVVSLTHAAALNGYGGRLPVHIAIDTGMHRLGESWDNTEALTSICRMEHLRIDGAFTHLCTADTSDGQDFTRQQAERFYTAVRRIRAAGFAIPKLHLLGSHGILRSPELGGDYARPGIALYGAVGDEPGLRPVLSLKARVAALHRLKPGDSAGYGLAFTAERETLLATVTLGYGDGLPARLGQGRGRALIRGRPVPIVGKICMDQCLLDATEAPKVCMGDEAVFIGASGRESISACELAAAAGSIPNEILSRLGHRLNRIMK